MKTDILSLTKQFIMIKSTFDNPHGLNEVLNLALSQCSRFTIEQFEHNGVKSALIYNTRERPEKFKIILNGHLDVVPGKKERYTPLRESNKLYGVGSLDMKASVACLITVFNEIAHTISYPLALQLVLDEEIGGFNGTKYQIEQGVNAEFVIAGEPTNLNIVHKAKGILCLKITARGKTAHGAYPWRGENAIWKMNAFLNKLGTEFPIPEHEDWITTVNVAKIETSNSSFNKIPDDCSVLLDVRFIPDDATKIVNTLKSITPADFAVQEIVNEPALQVEKSNVYIQNLIKVIKQTAPTGGLLYGANGSSDARHYTKIGTPGIEFGPVGGNIGADDEWVDTESLDSYCVILKKFLLSL